jgi:hypothetical protein
MEHIELKKDYSKMSNYYNEFGKTSLENFRKRYYKARKNILTFPENATPLAAHYYYGQFDEIANVTRIGLGEKPKNVNFLYNFIEYEDDTNYILALKSDSQNPTDTINSIIYRNNTKEFLSKQAA